MRVKSLIWGKKVFLLMLIPVFLVMSFFFPKIAYANNGRIVKIGDSDYSLDLSVCIDYDECVNDIDDWKSAFQKASELLYNSTEGQLQIGTIDVYINDPDKVSSCDIYITDEVDKSITSACPGLPGLSYNGQIILKNNAKYINGETGNLIDPYGQTWSVNTPNGYDTYFTSVSQFPTDFDDLIGKKTKLITGNETNGPEWIWFDSDGDHMHWRYGDNEKWCKTSSVANNFYYRTRIFYDGIWRYVCNPSLGAPTYECGFADAQDIAVVAMAVNFKTPYNSENDQYSLYIAKKNSSGYVNYYRFHTYAGTQPIPMTTIDHKGEVTIVHELGHYVFNLGDEYRGLYTINGEDWYECTTLPEDAKCTGDPDDPACLMDAGADPGTHWNRTEWCTPYGNGWNTDHRLIWEDETTHIEYKTEQQYRHGQSCWERIADVCSEIYSELYWEKYGYRIDIDMPTSEPSTAMPAGHQNIVWRINGNENELVYDPRSTIIVIDRSNTMSLSDITLAKNLALGFVDRFNPLDEELGIVSFNYSAPYLLGTLSLLPHDLVTGFDAKSAIDYTTVIGGCNIKSGLQAALDMIVPSQKNTKSVILISTGNKNYGNDPLDLVNYFKINGIKVYAVGVGTNVNETLLKNIALPTGGFYKYLTTESLTNILDSICGVTSKDVITAIITGGIVSYEQVTDNVYIDSYNNFVKLELKWPGSDLDLTLRMPDDTLVTPEFAETDHNIEYVEEDTREYYLITEPMAGEWEIIIDAVDVSGEEPFEFNVSSPTLGAWLNIFTDKEQYAYPENIYIQAQVSTTDGNVAGAEVTGTVTRPDESTFGITLYDDGDSLHGDDMANDGFYSNYFSDYAGDGTYAFDMVVENTDGVRAYTALEEPPEGEPPSVSPFIRQASTSVTFIRAETETLLDFPSSIQYSDMLSGKAILTSLEVPLENLDVEFGSLLPTEEVQTDENGESYNTPYKIELVPGSEADPIAAVFYGNSSYLESSDQCNIIIEKEDAELAYTGDILVETGNDTTLSCLVTQEDDGSPGDITYSGPVTFNVTDEASFNQNYNASVDEYGIATTDETLPVGIYMVMVSIESDYFTADPTEGIQVTVYSP